MPNIYVRSTDGSDVDDGSTWALAKATLAGADAIDAAGDTIYISDNHSESTAVSISIALAGTNATPTRIICGDDAAEPPTAVATTALIATTGASSISISGTAYFYGIQFRAASGGVSANLNLAVNGDNLQVFERCVLESGSTGGSGFTVAFGSNSTGLGSKALLINTDVKFNSATSHIKIVNGFAHWRGGALTGTALNTKIVDFGTNGRGGIILFDGIDLSNCAATVNLVLFSTGTNLAVFRNCKLPASWSGAPASIYYVGNRVEMYNCDSGDTNYRLWTEGYEGSTRNEITVVRTNGASDGTTPISWRMTSSANAEYPLLRLESPEIVQWNETTGTSLTVSVEIVHDSQGAGAGARLQNDEMWLEVMYLGTSGFPLGTWITDCKADVLAAAANQDDSSWTWSTPGMTAPVRQKLAVTFTAQEKGFIHARVVLAKASKTVYVCPKLTVL